MNALFLTDTWLAVSVIQVVFLIVFYNNLYSFLLFAKNLVITSQYWWQK